MPSATQFKTMSRSVIIPASLSSSPQIGRAPTPRSFILRAAVLTVSSVRTQSAPGVMISRAVMGIVGPSSMSDFSVSVSHPGGVISTLVGDFLASPPPRRDMHENACAPRHGSPVGMVDLAWRLLRQGYDAEAADRAARGRRADFESRLLGRRAVVLRSPDGARAFYDESLVRRRDAIPAPLTWLLFGRGAVHGLDAPEHRDRKGMFLELLAPERLVPLVEAAEAEFRGAGLLVARAQGRGVRRAGPSLWPRSPGLGRHTS